MSLCNLIFVPFLSGYCYYYHYDHQSLKFCSITTKCLDVTVEINTYTHTRVLPLGTPCAFSQCRFFLPSFLEHFSVSIFSMWSLLLSLYALLLGLEYDICSAFSFCLLKLWVFFLFLSLCAVFWIVSSHLFSSSIIFCVISLHNLSCTSNT